MRKNLYFMLCLMVVQLTFVGCDTTSNITDPSLTHYVKFYGDDGEQTGSDLVTLPDGSSILFGTSKATSPDSTSQWYLVKIDTKGAVIWSKKYGSSTVNETASDIELTADGKLVAVGNSYKTATERDVLIKTFTFDGVVINSALVGLKNSLNQETDEDAITVSLTSDGFIVTGSTSNTIINPNPNAAVDQRDAMHLRFFSTLQRYPAFWGNTYSQGTFDVAVRVISAGAAGYYVFGYTNAPALNHPTADYNYWVYRLDPNGTPDNAQLLIGPSATDEKLSSVAQSPIAGDGYALSGLTYASAGAADIYLTKLRKDLSFEITGGPGGTVVLSDVQFEKKFSINLGTGISEQTSIFASQLSGFYILANERNSNDNQNWLLTKANSDGSLAWSLPIVFGGEGTDTIGAIKELADGRLLIIGTMKTGKPDTGETKMTLLKVNKEGKLID